MTGSGKAIDAARVLFLVVQDHAYSCMIDKRQFGAVLSKVTQADAVVETIMLRVEDGSLLPGQQIDEKELAAACGVSRTPVREAVLQLEATGLVVRHPRKGVSLFHPDTNEFLAILEVHASLEAQAAELAALRISPDLEVKLAACADACSAFVQNAGTRDHSHYYRLNMQFHAIVAQAAFNPYLFDMIKLNARKLMAYYRLRYRTPGAIERSAQEHCQITGQILQRDTVAARASMVAHFNYDRAAVMHMIASVR